LERGGELASRQWNRLRADRRAIAVVDLDQDVSDLVLRSRSRDIRIISIRGLIPAIRAQDRHQLLRSGACLADESEAVEKIDHLEQSIAYRGLLSERLFQSHFSRFQPTQGR